MALLFVEGFDSLATADLDESFTSITGSPTVGSTYKRNGANGVQLSNGDYVNLTLTPTTTASGVTGMALYRVDSLASSFLDIRNGSGRHLYLRIESDATLALYAETNALLAQGTATTRWIGGAVLGDEKAHRRLSEACLRNLERNVPDPELRRRLTPDYQAACKRLVICSDFYPAISRPNAELVTEPIDCVDAKGVVTADGRRHDLDVLVLATGFDPTAFVLPIRVTGEGGVDLEKLWDGTPRAHRAMGVPGFPNLWMLEGPTGPIGNLSLITITELQVDYLVQCLDEMRRRGLEAMAPKPEAFEAYNAAIRAALPRTI